MLQHTVRQSLSMMRCVVRIVPALLNLALLVVEMEAPTYCCFRTFFRVSFALYAGLATDDTYERFRNPPFKCDRFGDDNQKN